MSKYVKELVTRDIRGRLEGVEDAVLVSYVGMDANTTNELRGELDKRRHPHAGRQELARPACHRRDCSLPRPSKARRDRVGVCWGSTDFRFACQGTRAARQGHEDKYDKFVADGGVMDGEKLDADGLKGGQQMAKPPRADLNPCWTDSRTRCAAVRGDAWSWQDAQQPNQTKRRR